jgi:hypothetical protein
MVLKLTHIGGNMSLDTNINETNKNEEKSNTLGFFARHKILTGFLIAIIAIVGWWKYEFPSATWNHKLTVTIETPEGLKTGSAVREVTYINGPKILPDVAGANWKVKGEAVVVDMGQGKYLFAIMDVDGSYRIVYDAFPYTPKSVRDGIRYYKSITGKKKTLDKSLYPTLVTFTDIKAPKTVTQVDASNLSATFGIGVTLKDVTIEMTDEDVTWGMEKYLCKRQMIGPYLFVKRE